MDYNRGTERGKEGYSARDMACYSTQKDEDMSRYRGIALGALTKQVQGVVVVKER